MRNVPSGEKSGGCRRSLSGILYWVILSARDIHRRQKTAALGMGPVGLLKPDGLAVGRPEFVAGDFTRLGAMVGDAGVGSHGAVHPVVDLEGLMSQMRSTRSQFPS